MGCSCVGALADNLNKPKTEENGPICIDRPQDSPETAKGTRPENNQNSVADTAKDD